MIRTLFLFSIALLSIAPIVSYGNLFSNFNVGDILFVLLSPFILVREGKFTYYHFIPVGFFLAYLVSSTFALFTFDYISTVNVGFILRFLYYFFIVIVISKFVVDRHSFTQVINSILIGLTLTLILVWIEWSNKPVYLGIVPMLHTVHDFVNFPINRNYIGFFIALGSGLSFSLLLISQVRNKPIYLTLLMFFLISSLFTFSKGTWLSSYLLIILFSLKRNPLFSSVLGVVLVLTTSFLYINEVGGVYELIERMSQRVEGSDSTNSDRLNYAVDALLMGLDYFPFGVGAEGYLSSAIYSGLNETKDPHNAVLWVFAESGFFGILLLTFTLFIILFRILSYRKHSESILLLGLFFPLVANMPFQGTPFSMKYLWLVLSLSLSLKFIYHEKNNSHNHRS